jgi:hypothetical protein
MKMYNKNEESVMKELLPRERAFKVVCTNDRNEDQDLFGFYPSAKFASRAIPLL